MHTKLFAVLLALILVLPAGCAKRYSSEHSVPTATPRPHRVDLAGNPITQEYTDGTFLRVEGNTLFAETDGKEKTFILSERAEGDLAALGIAEGTRMIINYTLLESGELQADSLEKILSE